MNIFEKLSAGIDSAEFSFTTLISKIVPWLVPIIPASVTGMHVSNTLQFGPLFGWIAGIVVEGLGFASIHRLFMFWQNNKNYTADKNRMPLWIPIVAFLWYLVVVLLVNTLLEIDAGASIVRVIAVGALTTLSIPTMAIIASTAIMTERKHERTRSKSSSKVAEDEVQDAETDSVISADWRIARKKMQKNTVRWIAKSSADEIMQKFRIKERTAYSWKKRANEELDE